MYLTFSKLKLKPNPKSTFYRLCMCFWFMLETCYIRFSIEQIEHITNVIGILVLYLIPWAKIVTVNFIWRFPRFNTCMYREVGAEVGIGPTTKTLSKRKCMYNGVTATRVLFIVNHNIGKMVMNLCLLK